MFIAHTIAALREQVRDWKLAGARIGFVPTMGALHAGHLSLVELARAHADIVIVSIFVNPTQFAPGEDYAVYPRTEENDIEQLKTAGVDLAWMPNVREMYPPPFSTMITVKDVSEGLCGAFRPGHFEGVATVVAKLFHQVQADLAVFGEKDYQQLQVIRRMVKNLDMPVEIIGAPILREADGLAMSSRNRYLNPDERQQAATLSQTLIEAARLLTMEHQPASVVLPWATQRLLDNGFRPVDYVELRDEELFEPVETVISPCRLLAAAHLGKTRLIDNLRVAITG